MDAKLRKKILHAFEVTSGCAHKDYDRAIATGAPAEVIDQLRQIDEEALQNYNDFTLASINAEPPLTPEEKAVRDALCARMGEFGTNPERRQAFIAACIVPGRKALAAYWLSGVRVDQEIIAAFATVHDHYRVHGCRPVETDSAWVSGPRCPHEIALTEQLYLLGWERIAEKREKEAVR